MPASQANVRDHNLRLITSTIFSSDSPLSRAQVAGQTGLAKTTVSTLVETLIKARIVHERPKSLHGKAGRPSTPIEPSKGTLCGLGMLIGTKKIGVRAVDLAGNVVADRIVFGNIYGSPPQQVEHDLGKLCRDVLDEIAQTGQKVIGGRLSLPGLVDLSGHLTSAKVLGADWDGFRAEALADIIQAPVTSSNEANLAAMAQTRLRNIAGYYPKDKTATPHTFIYISSDVGIGSAIVVNGSLITGIHGYAGEIGHIPVEAHGRKCICGNAGCLEMYAGLAEVLRDAGLDPAGSPDQLVALLEEGNSDATLAVERAAYYLANAIVTVVYLLDIPSFVFGGFYAKIFRWLNPFLERELESRTAALGHIRPVIFPEFVPDDPALSGGAIAIVLDLIQNPGPFIDRILADQ